jgi:hypothetical protein
MNLNSYFLALLERGGAAIQRKQQCTDLLMSSTMARALAPMKGAKKRGPKPKG